MWAELDVADLGLGDHPQLAAGFTATTPASGEALTISVSNWALHTTSSDGSTSRLLEDGEVAAKVGHPGAVHIDARDSCALPFLAGGQLWTVDIEGPEGATVSVDRVHDLNDGTYRVEFTASHAGVHHVKATLSEDGQHFRATFHVVASLAAKLREYAS